jgi:fumarate hydratase class I
MAGQAFRDLEWEKRVQICQESAIGAQFGGKYFTHDVRVIRLPRHAACPVGLGFLAQRTEIKGKLLRRNLCRAIRGESCAIVARDCTTFRASC